MPGQREVEAAELCHRAVRMLFVRSILPSHSVRAALYCAAAAAAPKIRLHTVTPLYEAAQLVLPDKQRHYLSSVMRLKPGDTVALFNGADGEWSAAVDKLDKRQGVLCVRSLLRPQPTGTDAAPVLAFALIKNARLPALIEKATELGVAELQPLVTQHCASRDVKLERLQAIATEAAEQCGRLDVPQLRPPLALPAFLGAWERSSPLFVCDERGGALPLSRALPEPPVGVGVLVGPEGGFSPAEFELLAEHEAAAFASLGSNTLRAETAALAALAVIACA